ncbi:MAG: 4Fe-4S binding protein [Chloroflexi bacterium]|nr:4Fe-4S binding protein [Chloroflexota bacterium]
MKGHLLLQDAIRSLFRRAATHRYPAERTATPERLRGKLTYNPEGCTGCCLCTKECPANAIEIITVDKANKQFVMRYHADRCIYCGQCVKNCRFGCLEMPNETWELASLTKTPFTVNYGEDADVERVLAGLVTPEPESTP